jgi:transcriptional regulator with XRE-family HTH domain
MGYMGLTDDQISELMKLRALGWSQKEIAGMLGTSQQVIAYQLKKLKNASKTLGVDDAFGKNAILPFLAGALTGAGASMLTYAVLQELQKSSKTKEEKK